MFSKKTLIVSSDGRVLFTLRKKFKLNRSKKKICLNDLLKIANLKKRNKNVRALTTQSKVARTKYLK